MTAHTALAETRTETCEECEGTGDYHRPSPQFDDPYLVTRCRGVDCPSCNGDGFIEIEVEPIDLDDLEEANAA